jgi:hypothetical protein
MRTFPVYRISLGLIVARLRNVAGSSVISPSPSASPWQNGFAERSRTPLFGTYGLKPSATSTAIVAERRQARGSSRPCLQWCRLAQNSGRCGSRRGPDRLPSLTFHELRASLLVGNYPYKRHRARHPNISQAFRSVAFDGSLLLGTQVYPLALSLCASAVSPNMFLMVFAVAFPIRS